jgi:hypothetical protein
MNKRRIAAALAAIGAAGLATGCVSHAHYPPVDRTLAYSSPNTPAVEDVMLVGLRWIATRYPPADESQAAPTMAVNLPEGVRGKVYQRVARAIPGAEPLTPENSHLPIFHVGHIRIRGDHAQVNIFRPISAVGPMMTGETVYQEVRLDLRGGLSPWRVVSWREWTPGSGDLPPLNYFAAEPAPVRDGPRVGGVYD